MNEATQYNAAGTRYCTLYHIGHWCSLDAECETERESGGLPLIDHCVNFRMTNKFGDRCPLGYSIITGQPDRAEVFDENGETFPDLDAAVRAHASRLLELAPMPGTLD